LIHRHFGFSPEADAETKKAPKEVGFPWSLQPGTSWKQFSSNSSRRLGAMLFGSMIMMIDSLMIF
jgi:hypothetical protein